MEDLQDMLKESSYKEELFRFFKYYQDQCENFIRTYDGSFSGSYFKDWYQTKGNEILQIIKQNLDFSRLDERVNGFIQLYQFYILSAQAQINEELLLENLFAVPNRLESEFTAFGFLRTEALADEQDWLSENSNMSEWSLPWPVNTDACRRKERNCQYILESDLSNRALF